MTGNGWLVLRPPKPEEHTFIRNLGYNPDEVEVLLNDGDMIIRPVNKALETFIQFLNSCVENGER